MIYWISRINLLVVLVVLLAFHGVLYYSLGTPQWSVVAFTATLVDTFIVAAVQLVIAAAARRKGKW
ncbi:hypothetical protein [Paenibacillus sp. y28]|uniref:hypothetical protein n=1 Tax=Paenibacillus sp. y28 TaxID=3129110 RepID=UPI003016A740